MHVWSNSNSKWFVVLSTAHATHHSTLMMWQCTLDFTKVSACCRFHHRLLLLQFKTFTESKHSVLKMQIQF